MCDTTIYTVYAGCVRAILNNVLIHRTSREDKEFHFQNWILVRMTESGFNYESGGRNSYPDFRMVRFTEGYEVKGLAYPGREVNYDCNSQTPSGMHNGRTIYYVFGRYPKNPDGNTYPVLDLVICHGDFLNADHDYVHKNKHVKGFGSYGDIMIRDRKMYVAPTPFGLVSGVAHQQTLILPAECLIPDGYFEVGTLTRREATQLIIGYAFDLRTNTIVPETVPNPHAGREHVFKAMRLDGSPTETVAMRDVVVADVECDDDNDGDD